MSHEKVDQKRQKHKDHHCSPQPNMSSDKRISIFFWKMIGSVMDSILKVEENFPGETLLSIWSRIFHNLPMFCPLADPRLAPASQGRVLTTDSSTAASQEEHHLHCETLSFKYNLFCGEAEISYVMPVKYPSLAMGLLGCGLELTIKLSFQSTL